LETNINFFITTRKNKLLQNVQIQLGSILFLEILLCNKKMERNSKWLIIWHSSAGLQVCSYISLSAFSRKD
jgi:hypothetical protein